jgi:hypothetical protein
MSNEIRQEAKQRLLEHRPSDEAADDVDVWALHNRCLLSRANSYRRLSIWSLLGNCALLLLNGTSTWFVIRADTWG